MSLRRTTLVASGAGTKYSVFVGKARFGQGVLASAMLGNLANTYNRNPGVFPSHGGQADGLN
jgi:hypothetical protein